MSEDNIKSETEKASSSDELKGEDNTDEVQSMNSTSISVADTQGESEETSIPSITKPSENEQNSKSVPSSNRRPARYQDNRKRTHGFSRFRRRGCRFCQNTDIVIHYRNPDILERFITERGKILPRRITGTCAKHQRSLATAIKRARILALLPFVVK